MSIYYVSLGNKEYQVEVTENHYKINGQVVQASLTALQERGFFLLRKGFWKREIHVGKQGKNQYALSSDGVHAVVKVEKNSPQLRKKDTASGAGITAPMPGQVVSVHVNVGDQVQKGQPLVVLESMKMFMTIHADCDGKVTRVNKQAGTQIAKGDVILIIESDPS